MHPRLRYNTVHSNDKLLYPVPSPKKRQFFMFTVLLGEITKDQSNKELKY